MKEKPPKREVALLLSEFDKLVKKTKICYDKRTGNQKGGELLFGDIHKFAKLHGLDHKKGLGIETSGNVVTIWQIGE